MTIYVVMAGDWNHGVSVFGATTDPAFAVTLAERAEVHYHSCYGCPPCDVTMESLTVHIGKQRYSPHVTITAHEDEQP